MNPIKLQQFAHMLWLKRQTVLARIVQKLIHIRYNSDLPPKAQIGGVLFWVTVA